MAESKVKKTFSPIDFIPGIGTGMEIFGAIADSKQIAKANRIESEDKKRELESYNQRAPLRRMGVQQMLDPRYEDTSGIFESTSPFARSGAAPPPSPEAMQIYNEGMNAPGGIMNPYDKGRPGRINGELVDYDAWRENYLAQGAKAGSPADIAAQIEAGRIQAPIPTGQRRRPGMSRMGRG